MIPTRPFRKIAHAVVSFAACLWAVLAPASCSRNEPFAPARCTETVGNRCWLRLGLEGEWVTALAVTDWGLYAGTRDHGLFRFDSAAGGWQPLGLSHAVVTSILFVPGAQSQLLVSVAPQGRDTVSAVVYSSRDGGLTWLPHDGGIAASESYHAMAQSLARDPVDPNVLFLGRSYPILRSLNGGTTWEYVFGNPNIAGAGIYSIAIPVVRSTRIWAAGQSGVLRAVVFRSDDDGVTWQVISPPQWIGNLAIRIVPDSLNPDAVLVGMGGGVQESMDAGADWQPVLSIPGTAVVMGLVQQAGMVWAASTEESLLSSGELTFRLGLYSSRDRGSSWDSIPVPPDAAGATDLLLDRAGRPIVATQSGVWRLVQ
jgi:hypothetical protein